MLTRDARQHERKKYGQKGARKRFQFSQALDCRVSSPINAMLFVFGRMFMSRPLVVQPSQAANSALGRSTGSLNRQARRYFCRRLA